MPEDDRTAEHGFHWLLDALHPGRRLRGQVFGIDEDETRALLAAIHDDLRARRMRPARAAHAIIDALQRLLAERGGARRLDRARPARGGRRSALGSPQPGAAPVPVALPRCLARLAWPAPPWLLDPLPRPAPPRPGRRWQDEGAASRVDAAPPVAPCGVRLLHPLLPRGFDPTAQADPVNAPFELEPERIAGLEIALRLTPGVDPEERITITSSEQMAAFFARALADAMDRERILVAPLDTRNRLIGIHAVAVGSSNRCLVSLADVYRAILLPASSRYFVAHNHPSGAVAPSSEDLVLTGRLYATGRELGIELCDHLILGFNGAYHSLRANGEGVAAWQRARRFDPTPTRHPLRLVHANDSPGEVR